MSSERVAPDSARRPSRRSTPHLDDDSDPDELPSLADTDSDTDPDTSSSEDEGDETTEVCVCVFVFVFAIVCGCVRFCRSRD